jgi:uncharacterized protein (TIGR00730 family)
MAKPGADLDSTSLADRHPGPMRAAVFCSANSGLDPEFFVAAEAFSAGLAKRGWELIYGGSRAGLMGCFADAMLAAGGVARGAITKDLAAEREMPHEGLQELVIVPDLFERKRWMMDQADVFLIFPGGFGTLDEALEVITWRALGHHDKPIVFVNLDGFWQSQIEVFREFSRNGMIRSGGMDLFEIHDALDTIWTVLDGLG